MNVFSKSPTLEEFAREVSRLTGENLAMRLAIAVLIEKNPDKTTLINEITMRCTALRALERREGAHFKLLSGIEDTLAAIRYMARAD